MIEAVLNLKVYRDEFQADTTRGKMFANDEFFGYTLEDAVRAPGVKIPGATAIPDGTYTVKVTKSTRLKKRLPEVLNVRGFYGVRIHGGNDHEDTEGCTLVARSLALQDDGDFAIFGSLSSELVELIDRFKFCFITYVTVGNI